MEPEPMDKLRIKILRLEMSGERNNVCEVFLCPIQGRVAPIFCDWDETPTEDENACATEHVNEWLKQHGIQGIDFEVPPDKTGGREPEDVARCVNMALHARNN